jgi:hypothetical protein
LAAREWRALHLTWALCDLNARRDGLQHRCTGQPMCSSTVSASSLLSVVAVPQQAHGRGGIHGHPRLLPRRAAGEVTWSQSFLFCFALCLYDLEAMKTKPTTYHIGIAPTSRARCRGRCKRQVQKGSARIVVTAYVKHGHTVRFTRCAACIDSKLAAAISGVYGDPACIPSTPDVDAETVEEIRATITRLAERPAIMPAPCREAAQP